MLYNNLDSTHDQLLLGSGFNILFIKLQDISIFMSCIFIGPVIGTNPMHNSNCAVLIPMRFQYEWEYEQLGKITQSTVAS